MKKIFISLFFVIVTFSFLPVLSVHAEVTTTGLAQLSQCTGTDCTACNVVYMANGLIKWLIGFCFILFAILLTVAGVRMVTSGGNSSAVEESKNSFVNALIGLVIILSAWLIVDTIMRALVGSPGHEGQLIDNGSATGYLFWSQVSCQVQEHPEDNGQETIGFSDSQNLISSGNISNIPTVQPGGTYKSSSNIPTDGQFTYQSGVSDQRSSASPELQMLLNCMVSQLPGNVGEISSISEKAIANGSKTFEQCWAGGCEHVAGSCHYGNGYGVIGKSYAVDFGDENNATDLMGAAYACGAGFAGIHNGNHVHVSAKACRGN